MRIRTRILSLLAISFLALIIVFSLTIYYLIANYGFTDFYERLESRAKIIARIELDHRGEKAYLEQFRADYLNKLPNEKYFIYEINDVDARNKLPKKEQHFLNKVEKLGKYRLREGSVFRFGMHYTLQNGNEFIVETKATNSYFESYTAKLRNFLLIGVGVSLLVVLLISVWLSKRLIRPITSITQNINKISSENLHVRLIASNEQDELGKLTKTLNGMFDRLETSFETQNNFISNASHELNTPLTAIMGETELTLSRDRTKDEYILTLQRIQAEAEKLNYKTQALLSLAQTGFNGKTVNFVTVNLVDLLLESIATVIRIQGDPPIELDYTSFPQKSEDLEILGNRDLLLLAFSNIIGNACKYSNNKRVQVYFETDKEGISVLVRDLGIGIPEKELAFIYDPFFRASNTDKFHGYGIGLPLTRNIMRLHGAKLEVYSKQNEGTLVKMSFLHLK